MTSNARAIISCFANIEGLSKKGTLVFDGAKESEHGVIYALTRDALFSLLFGALSFVVSHAVFHHCYTIKNSLNELLLF